MTWMTAAAIEAALSQVCASCGADEGVECVDSHGRPLVESTGRCVHIRRLEP
jgi:hypothetical protein